MKTILLPIIAIGILSYVVCMMSSCTCAPDINTPQEIDPTTKAQLRILHFSPLTPAMNLLQNDRSFATDIAYGVSAVPYKELPSGIRNLRFTGENNAALYSINVELAQNTPYTLLLLDSAERRSGLLLNDIPPTIGQENIAVRFVHAGIGAGSASVYKGSAGGTQLFSKQDFRSFTPYVTVAKGESISVSVATPSGTRVFVVDSSALSAGSAYTLILAGIDAYTTTPLILALVKG